jgi:2,3-dihydroxybiphenyl 1,2-dioxygenase
MDEYHHRILLHPTGEDDILYMGWSVAGPAEVRVMRERLTAAGVEVRDGTAEEAAVRKVKAFIRFQDPAGYAMEIYYGGLDKAHEPFRPARPMQGFKAGPQQGLGHVVLRVADRDACERFYTEVLGLHLSDYGSGRLAFFHCNLRHHSIAIGPQDMPGPRRIIHIMLEALSLDDLGTAQDLCEQHGVTMTETLGKHPNDLMVSFYLDTPSGFQIEYGFGGRDIDEDTWEVRSYEKRDLWGHKRLSAH